MPEVVMRLFAPGDAAAFRFLNKQWITTLVQMEASDEAALSDPEGAVVGCVVPMPNHCYELAKMAVAPEAQGRDVLVFRKQHALDACSAPL